MTRIAILTSEFLPFYGGVGTYVRELAAACTRLGHDVTVFAPSYGKRLEDFDKENFDFSVRRYPSGMGKVASYPRYAAICVKVARSNLYDKLLAADIPMAEMMAVTYPFHRREYAVTVHGTDINKEKVSLRGMLLRPFGVFDRPVRFFANSHFTKKLLLSQFPRVDPELVTVTHLGVSREWFEEPTRKVNILEDLGVPLDHAVITTVARVTPRKGQLLLIKAVTLLPESIRRRLSCVLIGSSSDLNHGYVEEVRAAAKSASPARIVIRDHLSDDNIKNLFRASTAFCLPGAIDDIEVEGFGLVFLEAAAQGLPSVAGKVGGVPEVVVNENTGLLFEPDQPAELAQALMRIIEDKSLRNKLGQQASSAARGFTWEECGRKTCVHL